uniref:Uncharacterized protein MANES_08G163700 n=1 Tax=Rhizophora mucronata TaxID=61149 RepID=A0A2P2J382_RHIMU
MIDAENAVVEVGELVKGDEEVFGWFVSQFLDPLSAWQETKQARHCQLTATRLKGNLIELNSPTMPLCSHMSMVLILVFKDITREMHHNVYMNGCMECVERAIQVTANSPIC